MTTWFLIWGTFVWVILPTTKFRNTGGRADWSKRKEMSSVWDMYFRCLCTKHGENQLLFYKVWGFCLFVCLGMGGVSPFCLVFVCVGWKGTPCWISSICNLMFDSGWSKRSGCCVMEKQRLEKQTGRLGVQSAPVLPRAVWPSLGRDLTSLSLIFFPGKMLIIPQLKTG